MDLWIFFLSHFSFLLFHRARISGLKQKVTQAAVSLNPPWNRLESNMSAVSCSQCTVVGSLVHLSWDALKGISLNVGSWPSWISQNFCSVPGTAVNTGKWMEPVRLQAAPLHLSVWLPLGTAGWKWRRKRLQCLLIKLQTAISNKGMGTPLWSTHCLGLCNIKNNYVAHLNLTHWTVTEMSAIFPQPSSC